MLNEAEFRATITIGQVYYFVSDQINSPVPHYFVVIHTFKDIAVHLICTTTQYDKRVRYFEINEIPEICLVEIRHDQTNKLTLTSWVDCNSTQLYYHDDLWEMYSQGKIEIKGIFTAGQLSKIYAGLQESPLIEEDKKTIFPKK
jgi:hypothetical protein